MIFEKINTVIVSRGRGQSVGGLGAKASEGREQQQQQQQQKTKNGGNACLFDRISESPEFFEVEVYLNFPSFFVFCFLFYCVHTHTHWVLNFITSPFTQSCEKKKYNVSQGSSAISSHLYKN